MQTNLSSFSMELPVSTSLFCSVSRSSSWCPYSTKNHSISLRKFRRRLNNRTLKPIRIKLSLKMDDCSSNVNRSRENEDDFGSSWEDSEFVEVVGIGSRKDSVLEFCLNSPMCSSTLRFWNILMTDSMKVLLQQKLVGKDSAPRIIEAPLSWHSCSKAVILVASAAYGPDHITAIDILKTVKSANGLSVGVILKPFSFEGRRRQDEVKDLMDKLQEHTNFCIVVDTDALLKKDLVTLDEALKTANSAVLMAINAIFVLISDRYKKLLPLPDNSLKELDIPEVIKILERYKEAKIGFGAGYNISTSFLRAVYDCPFLSLAVKDLNGIILCILASSGVISSSDMQAFLETFRRTTDCKGVVIISTVHEPNLEPNQVVTTIIAVGSPGKQAPQKMNIFSKLAQQFPFIFSLLRGNQDSHTDDNQESCSPENLRPSEVLNSADSGQMPNMILVDGTAEGFDIYSAEIQTLLSKYGDEIHSLRDYGNDSEQSEVEFSEVSADSSTLYEPYPEGVPAFQREPLIRRNLGPGYEVPQEWARERPNDSVATPGLDNHSTYLLPVGVKSSEELKDSPIISRVMHNTEKITDNDIKGQSVVTRSKSWDAMTDASFTKKQGVLSLRATSMLEAERDSQKKWSPIVEMKYRGGIYRGRCQGGLPEGKGCLSLADGSIYDGMWRYGKRSGLGAFYFNNGDVFQGSWRDDVMHGKGWFYFHTGDRWFANFWKGKANGEGRFYSKLGDIFFGHFKDGWRQGHFLCINVNGARCLEIWDEGVLVSHKELDSDAGAG